MPRSMYGPRLPFSPEYELMKPILTVCAAAGRAASASTRTIALFMVPSSFKGKPRDSSLAQRRHHFPHEKVHRAHRPLRREVAEGEHQQQVVDSRLAHDLAELLRDRLRRAADEAQRRVGR